MSQVSIVNAYYMDPFSNIDMKKRFLRHKNNIQAIGKKSSHYENMEQEQQRIMDKVHKSKQISRKFQLHQFELRKSIENKRMINHISRLYNRKHSTLEVVDQVSILNKKMKSHGKEQILRQFQINLQNKSMNQHLQEYSVNKKKYRKKVKQQIEQYQKLRLHMQKFKNSYSVDSGVSNKKLKSLSNRPKDRSKNSISPSFFNEQSRKTPINSRMSQSRSLPPLQMMIV